MNFKEGEVVITRYAKNKSGYIWQNKNCIRIWHIPSGVVVESEQSEGVHKNTEIAIEKLKAVLKQQSLNFKTKGCFSNKHIKERTPNKPHIVLFDGRWRVSQWNRESSNLYQDAYDFVIKLNAQRDERLRISAGLKEIHNYLNRTSKLLTKE